MVYFSFSPIQGAKKGGVKAAAKPKATQKVNDHHVLHLLEEIDFFLHLIELKPICRRNRVVGGGGV